MTRRHTSDLTRRFPAIAISIVAFSALFAAVLGDGDERYIYTFGGTGVAGGDVGDGGPATEAQLNYPRGPVLDGSGNLYVVDGEHHRIRRIDAERVITTIAGTGEGGFGGDGGPATEAQLAWPNGLALDGSGNLYVTDSGNNRVRRIDAEGVITTIAGTGERRGRRPGNGGPTRMADRAGAGWLGQPLCGRPQQSSNPADRCRGSDHDHRGNGGRWIRRGRRPGDGGPTPMAQRAGAGRIGQPLRGRHQ